MQKKRKKKRRKKEKKKRFMLGHSVRLNLLTRFQAALAAPQPSFRLSSPPPLLFLSFLVRPLPLLPRLLLRSLGSSSSRV